MRQQCGKRVCNKREEELYLKRVWTKSLDKEVCVTRVEEVCVKEWNKCV